VEVGPQKIRHQIYKGLLCHYSEYFRGALKGGFKQSESGLVALVHAEEKIFQAFHQWLMMGSLTDQDDQLSVRRHSKFLIDVYVFGDAHGIPLLKNAVLDVILRDFNVAHTVPTTWIGYIYGNTTKNDELQKLILDM
ncbi:hypothetical protein EJ08DRAFT_570120, partial [Tothia fuscella]